jgi:plastocyanin
VNLRTPWFCAVLLFAGARAGEAGVVRGTVHLPAAGAARAALKPYAGNANALPGAGHSAPGRPEDTVIHVESLDAAVAAALPASPGKPELVQRNQAFEPRVLAIAAGTEVEFPNRDAIYHNVFSLSPTQRFDLGKYPRGQSKRVTFRRTGRVHVFCDIHSNMEAYVVVLPHRAFARPDASGAYALPDLPGGTYELVLWHPDFGETRRTVTVPADGDARVDLEFR